MKTRFLVALALIIGLVAPLPAYAATDPYGQLTCSNGSTDSTICQTKGKGGADPITGANGILTKVTNVVAFVAGAAAVLFIVFAGIKYITAQGDSSQISSAKQSIIYAAVGLVAIVLARQLITFVLSKI